MQFGEAEISLVVTGVLTSIVSAVIIWQRKRFKSRQSRGNALQVSVTAILVSIILATGGLASAQQRAVTNELMQSLSKQGYTVLTVNEAYGRATVAGPGGCKVTLSVLATPNGPELQKGSKIVHPTAVRCL